MTKNKKYKIVVGAQACGFGPISKLISIISTFDACDKIFIGNDIALDFANKHKSLFIRVVDRIKINKKDLEKVIVSCDFLVIVMDHDLAFMAHRLKKRYYFIDSLFGFWYSVKSDDKLYKIFKRLKENKGGILDNKVYDSFKVHEKKLLSHYLSEKSFVQNFFGVRGRVHHFQQLGLDSIVIMKPIAVEKSKKDFMVRENGVLLINLGGIKNFIIKNNYCNYISLIERMSIDLISELDYINKIIICSGCYQNKKVIKINNKSIECVFLSKEEFIKKVKNSQFYISSPGITAFYEPLYLFRPTIFLPEQHSSQYYNINHLKKTFLKKYCISIFDIIGHREVSSSDLRGSCQIMDYVDEILKHENYYLEFKKKLIGALDLIRQTNLKLYRQKADELINQLNRGIDLDFRDLPSLITNNENKYGA